VEVSDLWVRRFLRMTRHMERLAGLALTHESGEAYTRYRYWLHFAHHCERATSVVSRDLDYQPLEQMSVGLT
jgi:hypothetical protein